MATLLDELRAAFPPVPLDAKGAFSWYSDAELCERAVTGKTWEQIDPRLVARSDSLAFLSLDRFVAWLPMYLHHLVTTEPGRSTIWQTLMGRLAPRRRFEQLANRLSAEQRRVVARCLQFVVARRPPRVPQPDRTLVLGTGPRLANVLRELDTYCAPGSEAVVVGETEVELPKLSNMTVRRQTGDLTDRACSTPST